MRRVLTRIRKFLMTFIPFAAWERAQEQGSRSTVLRPIGWLIIFCASGALTAASIPHPIGWLTVLFGIGTATSVLLYLAAYCYCLLRMPDALRTERYSIQKLALEKGFYGDSTTGIALIRDNPQGMRQIAIAKELAEEQQ